LGFFSSVRHRGGIASGATPLPIFILHLATLHDGQVYDV
jgi:hypothetical protein